MMKKYRIFIFSIFLSLFLFLPLKANAASASYVFSGGGELEYGGTKNVTLAINVSSGATDAWDGELYSTNPGCISIESVSTVKPTNGAGGTSFIGFDTDGRSGRFDVLTFRVKAGNSVCSASVTFSRGVIAFQANSEGGNKPPDVDASGSVSFSVRPPKSGNNNLSSLSLSTGSINFSPGNTNYSVNVAASVTSITISATKEDSKASVSGDGTKGLGYGNNTFNVVVTAENGSKKTYTINVNRADDRSKNNNLKSLSFSNAKLKTNFDPSKTTYDISVPYEVSKLDIKAVAQDGKARISINNPSLVAEETVTATITVTAENGAQKTYTLKVARGKDPNKILSTNGYLKTFKSSYGDLSPVFNKEKYEYALYVPYEVEKVDFTYEVEDKKYATVKQEKPEKLLADSYNTYKFIVTAEDESKTTYTVYVYRGKNMEEEKEAVSLNIKKLKVKSGKLTTTFSNNETNYTYTGDFKCDYELEDENATSKTFKVKDLYVIRVEDSLGNSKTYSFIKKSSNMLTYTLLGIIFVLILIILYLVFIKEKISRKKGK